MNPTRRKVDLFFVVLALCPFPTLALAELISGFATAEAYFGAYSWGCTFWWIGSSGIAFAVLKWLLDRLEAAPSGARVLGPLVFFLVWGPIHALGFSFLFHAGSSYAADLNGQIIAAVFAGATGLSFAELGVIALVADLERIVPFVDARGNRRVAGRLDLKLYLSISGVVLAFLFGTIGATSMPAHAGLPYLDGLFRVCLLAIPFLAFTVVLTGLLSQLIIEPVVKATPLIEALAHDDHRAVLAEPTRDELSFLFHNLNVFLARLTATVAEARD